MLLSMGKRPQTVCPTSPLGCLLRTLKPLPYLQISSFTRLVTHKWPTYPLNNSLKWELSNFYQQTGKIKKFLSSLLCTAGVLPASHAFSSFPFTGQLHPHPTVNTFLLQLLLFCPCHCCTGPPGTDKTSQIHQETVSSSSPCSPWQLAAWLVTLRNFTVFFTYERMNGVATWM